MIVKERIIDLDLPPKERWKVLKDDVPQLKELINYYNHELKSLPFAELMLKSFKKYIPNAYLREAEGIAELGAFTCDEVLLVNLQYELLQHHMGCTAFAVATDTTVLHARNLDWFAEGDILSKHTLIFDFVKQGVTLFKSVGWPGFIGVFSGVKPNAFSLTLNAADSFDKPKITMPVSFFLRTVLEQENSFENAKQSLEQTQVSSDCLLLLSGTKAHQRLVIERTPTKSKTRIPKDNNIVVANEYRLFENNRSDDNELQQTSDSRYKRTLELLQKEKPNDYVGCMEILWDNQVKQYTTVQQMVFDNKTGKVHLHLNKL